MGLNKSKGNMYEFITHTWNTIKGKCEHDCSYCYVKDIAKRFNSPQKQVRFDEDELKTNLGSGNFIFVGSSCDMFSPEIEYEWTLKTLSKCRDYDNDYFFQSKNPFGFDSFIQQNLFPKNTAFCTTIETNRFYKEIMGNTPKPHERAFHLPANSYITIEPIIDFDLIDFLSILKAARPKQINIGANTGRHVLPEPSRDKVMQLIEGLNEFTTIHNKQNLNRILTK